MEVHDGCRVMLTFDAPKQKEEQSNSNNADILDLSIFKIGAWERYHISPGMRDLAGLLEEVKQCQDFDIEEDYVENSKKKEDEFALADQGEIDAPFDDYDDVEDFAGPTSQDKAADDSNPFDFTTFEQAPLQHPILDAESVEGKRQNGTRLSFSNSNDYAFFDKENIKNWASASHWKFFKPPEKDLKPTSSKEKPVISSKPTKKKPQSKQKEFIDFWGPHIKDSEWEPPKSRVKNRISKSVRKKQEESAADLLLPSATQDFDPDKLMRLFLKPNLHISFTNTAERKFIVPGSERREDASAASENPTFPVGVDDDDDDDGIFGFDFGMDDDYDDPLEATQTTPTQHDVIVSGELELIEQPRKAQRMQINFARTSKRVDVRALKANIWKAVQLGHHDDVKEEDPSARSSFQEVVGVVNDALPPQLQRDVSIPYYFICLLHLANEHNLQLVPEVNPFEDEALALGNFIIEG
eukprot:TRINITY_DN4312_c0_g3_i1.p2 TRINITY_DN4312_c0_g3~~TRINITY_DN4312_c0_g3_i1.p2  ORF type:complete len:485 (-),score=160.68 TRINITY_DN4312_c0_g3_i1:1746-3149(-)